MKKCIIGLICAIDCITNAHSLTSQTRIEVKNTLNFSRNEVVAIPVDQLKALMKENRKADIRIKDSNHKVLTVQWMDNDSDGQDDELLFQAVIEAKKTNRYSIVVDRSVPVPESRISTYSRLVPERVDDYAWENDKIAFRVYGPKGQQEALQGIKSSTLSSGVDIWLKRTDLPVINKWYKGYLTDPMFYHRDTREEGYDPYHVGNSRGTGGIGIWVNDNLQVSQNFVTAKTIAEGPLRTVFELTYNPWSEYGVKETKRISLDLGSNFSKFESCFEAEKPVPNYTIGISLHKNEGETVLIDKEGYYLHWEKMDDAFVGEGIVVHPKVVEKSMAFKSETPDQSNLLVITRPQKKLIYYAGFAWQKSGQIKTRRDWELMLQQKAAMIATPLIIKIK
ncbi:DUF4861 domain-containing protein [Chryseobacterium shigense]|uniref:DUF4861 domain-containing protein n=1 Tax=Chryseobacterium shigense TaxID=297244 RepID=A0A1N7I049_9FLAO|nr:DUF4861 family protein [Chryseobacterium shigense]PQA97814.1 DUF4861 domain-containing protein [Chryseobacterium shigense]SIS30454.1 protein of unknown function [Chryseobacterium shigense]